MGRGEEFLPPVLSFAAGLIIFPSLAAITTYVSSTIYLFGKYSSRMIHSHDFSKYRSFNVKISPNAERYFEDISV